MRQMHYYIANAETEVSTSKTADTTKLSETKTKPIISGALLIDELRYAFNAGQNLTESKYGNMQTSYTTFDEWLKVSGNDR